MVKLKTNEHHFTSHSSIQWQGWGSPLILGKKNKKITEAKKASRGSEQPPLPSAQGLATISI